LELNKDKTLNQIWFSDAQEVFSSPNDFFNKSRTFHFYSWCRYL